jgi:hypothetical protein
MDIYSPKSQKPENFKRNTRKETVNISRKPTANSTGRTYVFDISENKKTIGKPIRKKKNISIFDLMKTRFYERMKVFFESDDKYKEKVKLAD